MNIEITPTLKVEDGRPMANSRDVAFHFGKLHKNVLQAIELLEMPEERRRLNFQPRDYVDSRGKKQPSIDMTRNGLSFLVMWFNGDLAARWKWKYIDAFDAMEAQLREDAQNPKRAIPAYMRRNRANVDKIPRGYFSMVTEVNNFLVARLEKMGYALPDHVLPDISEGKVFCNWLRKERGINPDGFPTYLHEYEDGRVYPAKLYPMDLMGDFDYHFTEVWLSRTKEALFANWPMCLFSAIPPPFVTC